MATGSFNHLPRVIAALERATSEIVTARAKALAADVQSRMAKDTGFMASAVYYKTASESSYGHAITPTGDATLLPELEAPASKTAALVAGAASYTVYVEVGTRYQPAQPAFVPAAAAEQARFIEAFSELEAKLAEAAR